MSLREQINHAYDNVHAPEDTVARLKEQLRSDTGSSEPVPEFKPSPHKKKLSGAKISTYAVTAAAAIMLVIGGGMVWRDVQQSKNPLRPQMAVHTEPSSGADSGESWVMISLLGMEEKQARILLESYGMVVETKTTSSTQPSGTVVAQSYPAGEALMLGTKIILTIAE